MLIVYLTKIVVDFIIILVFNINQIYQGIEIDLHYVILDKKLVIQDTQTALNLAKKMNVSCLKKTKMSANNYVVRGSFDCKY